MRLTNEMAQLKKISDVELYKKAVLEIQALSGGIVKEIRKEAEKQDRDRESLDPFSDAS